MYDSSMYTVPTAAWLAAGSAAAAAVLAAAGAALAAAFAAALCAVSAGAAIEPRRRWRGARLPCAPRHRAARHRAARHSAGRNERGEGVISAAIAVLIIASLGALMWVGFRALWENAEETTNSEIAKIGK